MSLSRRCEPGAPCCDGQRLAPTHLSHLTLAQVFDALSYYADRQTEIQQHSDRNPDLLTYASREMSGLRGRRVAERTGGQGRPSLSVDADGWRSAG